MRCLIVSLFVVGLFFVAGCQSDELQQCREKNKELAAKITMLEQQKVNMEAATSDLIKAMAQDKKSGKK